MSLLDEDLTSENLDEIHHQLFQARTSWFNIGMALGLLYDTVDNIAKECPSDNDKALRVMLAKRLRKDPLTWRELCEVLKRTTVGRNDVATTIMEYVRGKEAVSSTVKGGDPMQQSSTSRKRKSASGADDHKIESSSSKKPKDSPAARKSEGATPSRKKDNSEGKNGCSTGAPTIKTGKINDYTLMKIAKDIGDKWLEVGLALGVEYSKLKSRILDKYTTPVPTEQKAMDMLQEWKGQAADKFTYETLAKALEDEDLNTCARTHCYTNQSTVTENEQ